MPDVLIVQRRIPEYRVPLFNRLRHELKTRGVDLSVVAGSGSESEGLRDDAGLLEWSRQVPTRYFLNGRVCWQSLRDQTREADLVVLTHELFLLHNYPLLGVSRPRRVAFWGHGFGPSSGAFRPSREILRAAVSRLADWWFAYTVRSASVLKRAGYPHRRITVVNNASDTVALLADLESLAESDIAIASEALGLSGKTVGLSLGALYGRKRTAFLLECARCLHDADESFELIIVGDGPDRAEVMKFSENHSWCRLLGPKRGREKALALRLADVMLNPGGVGLGILDSFCAGVPMVTTDCGLHGPEIAYLDDGQNGVMTGNSVASFVEGVREVVTPGPFRSRLLDGCLASSARYSIEDMSRRFTRGIIASLSTPLR